MKHCPAEAGQFRPVITGFRPSRQWRISLRASARNFSAGHSALQCKLFRDSAGLWPAGTYFTCIAALMSCIEICLWQMKLPLTRHLNPLESGLNCCGYTAATTSCSSSPNSHLELPRKERTALVRTANAVLRVKKSAGRINQSPRQWCGHSVHPGAAQCWGNAGGAGNPDNSAPPTPRRPASAADNRRCRPACRGHQ